jgi:hypothetical protein
MAPLPLDVASEEGITSDCAEVSEVLVGDHVTTWLTGVIVKLASAYADPSVEVAAAVARTTQTPACENVITPDEELTEQSEFPWSDTEYEIVPEPVDAGLAEGVIVPAVTGAVRSPGFHETV